MKQTNRLDFKPRAREKPFGRLFSHLSGSLSWSWGVMRARSVTFEKEHSKGSLGTCRMKMVWGGNWLVAEQLPFESICQSCLKLGDSRGTFDLRLRWSDYPEMKAGVKTVWSDGLKWWGVSGEECEERGFMMRRRLVLIRSGRCTMIEKRFFFFFLHAQSLLLVHFLIWLSVIKERCFGWDPDLHFFK